MGRHHRLTLLWLLVLVAVTPDFAASRANRYQGPNNFKNVRNFRDYRNFNPGYQNYGKPAYNQNYNQNKNPAAPGQTDDDGRQLQQWQIAVVVPPQGQGQPGGYPQQPGGYPQQPGGYPQQPGGYPQQPGGYPQQPGGYPQQPGGYPQQPGGGYPQQPDQQTGQLGGSYPQQPGQGQPPQTPPPPSYPQEGTGSQYPQQPSYPSQQPGYPSQQPSYPPQQPPQQPPPGNIWIQVPVSQGPSQPYPPQQPSYPPPQQPSYPPPQQPSYPPPQQPSYPAPQEPSYPPPPPQEPSYPPPEYPAPDPAQIPPEPQQPGGGDSETQAALRRMCKEPRGQFPSDNSCSRFVNCWDDTVVEQSCPAGLFFSEEKGYCDFPYNVECGQRDQGKPPPVSGQCPTPYGTYRSSINCTAFVVCDNGRAINFNCPRGLDYNDQLGVCDYPYRVDCGGLLSASSLPPEPEDGGDGSYGGNGENGGDGSQGGAGSDGGAPAPVPEVGDGPGTMPPAEEPNNEARFDSSLYNAGSSCYHRKVYKLNPHCTSVSFCRRGVTNIISCPKGYAFDTRYGRCLPYGRARC